MLVYHDNIYISIILYNCPICMYTLNYTYNNYKNVILYILILLCEQNSKKKHYKYTCQMSNNVGNIPNIILVARYCRIRLLRLYNYI